MTWVKDFNAIHQTKALGDSNMGKKKKSTKSNQTAKLFLLGFFFILVLSVVSQLPHSQLKW